MVVEKKDGVFQKDVFHATNIALEVRLCREIGERHRLSESSYNLSIPSMTFCSQKVLLKKLATFLPYLCFCIFWWKNLNNMDCPAQKYGDLSHFLLPLYRQFGDTGLFSILLGWFLGVLLKSFPDVSWWWHSIFVLLKWQYQSSWEVYRFYLGNS